MMSPMSSSRIAPFLAMLAGAAGFLAFGYAFHVRYWAWRDCFNELGRCYDPDGTGQVYTTAGQMWGLLSLAFLLLLCASAFVFFRRRS